MKLIGEVVKHKSFGRGEIINFENNYITVLFKQSHAEKKFTYPTAFGAFLELENDALIKDIDEDKRKLAQVEAEKKRISEERARAETDSRSKDTAAKHSGNNGVKADHKNNIAFKCNYCDGGKSDKIVGYRGICSDETIRYNINTAKHVWCSQKENICYKYLQDEVSRKEVCKYYEAAKGDFSKSVCCESQMLEIWSAGAGITQNGGEKGKPMSIKNVKANNLALLTTILPNAEEKDRFIFAVFLINESYEGDSRNEGYVTANPKYRMELSPEETRKLKFWDYYYNSLKPEKIFIGSGQHRYFTDIQAAQVLKKICKIKQGTSEEKLSKEFLDYFCRLKKLEIDDIPAPNGVLQRIVK